MKQIFEKSRRFIYQNARPIELALFRYHFENGNKEDVLKSLSAYQNEDGGFGYGLEPDCTNPNSSPIQTWQATEILREVNFTDHTHPVIKGILRYLKNSEDFNGKVWFNTVKTNNEYPCAPWWTWDEKDAQTHWNPTAALVGFVLKFEEKKSDFYKQAISIGKEAVESLSDTESDMHILACYVRLAEVLLTLGLNEIMGVDQYIQKLKRCIPNAITRDTALWENTYVYRPSHYFNTKDSIFYPENKELAEYECDFIRRTQQEDGSWSINWNWGMYPQEWEVAKHKWMSRVIINHLVFLSNMC